MEKVNSIRTGRHCVFLLHVHLVFVTKYRRGVFTKAILDDLKEIFASVCHDFEAELVEFDGEDDHVHLLVTYPPKIAISALVNSLKGVSSRLIRKKRYPSIQIKTSMERWPGMWKAFEHSVKHWFVEKQREGIRGHKAHKTADEYWQAYLHGFEKQETKE